MMKLFHTLYLNEPELNIRLKGKALLVEHAKGEVNHIPLNMVENIVVFSKSEVDDEVSSYCAKNNIGLWFLTKTGMVRYHVVGETHGNVKLRKQQYFLSEKEERIAVEKSMLLAKIKNEIIVLAKFKNNHPDKVDEKMLQAGKKLKKILEDVEKEENEDKLRGFEGNAAKIYFDVFDKMILSEQKELHFLNGRNRRPPKDCCNALLSFVYTLLMVDCTQALESVGLDPYVGFLHRDRLGRPSLALDLMEEFRPLVADRFVLRLINLKMITPEMFEKKSEGVYLSTAGKSVVLQNWNHMKKQNTIIQGIDEEVCKGLYPHIQAQRLARYLRQEVDEYQAMIGR